jgi:hypothetical protein
MTIFWFFIGVVGFGAIIILINRGFSVNQMERESKGLRRDNPSSMSYATISKKKKKGKNKNGFFNYED